MRNWYLGKAAALFSIVCMYLTVTGCDGSPSQKVITNTQVANSILDGTTSGAFTDIASYIDTKVPIEGSALFPNTLVLDPTVKAVLLANFNGFLDTSQTPTFSPGNAALAAGVTVDQNLKKITVTSGAMTVSWSFEANRVTRALNDGAGITSSYVYSTVGGQTTVSFDQRIVKTNLVASYNGTATVQLNAATGALGKIVGATFTQSHTETNSLDSTSNTVNGTVTMRGSDAGAGNLSFNGNYSVNVPGYGQVGGYLQSDRMTYLVGYKADENAYYNSNLVNSDAVFTSTSDYSDVAPTANPTWLQGIWTGTFTDGSAGVGPLQMSVTATTMTWWGQSTDLTRFYGTRVSLIYDNTMHLYDGTVAWGSAPLTVGQTSIAGTWSENGRSGTFTLSKQ